MQGQHVALLSLVSIDAAQCAKAIGPPLARTNGRARTNVSLMAFCPLGGCCHARLSLSEKSAVIKAHTSKCHCSIKNHNQQSSS